MSCAYGIVPSFLSFLAAIRAFTGASPFALLMRTPKRGHNIFVTQPILVEAISPTLFQQPTVLEPNKMDIVTSWGRFCEFGEDLPWARQEVCGRDWIGGENNVFAFCISSCNKYFNLTWWRIVKVVQYGLTYRLRVALFICHIAVPRFFKNPHHLSGGKNQFWAKLFRFFQKPLHGSEYWWG